jgi:hypothetical protein
MRRENCVGLELLLFIRYNGELMVWSGSLYEEPEELIRYAALIHQLGDDGDVDRAMGNIMPCE